MKLFIVFFAVLLAVCVSSEELTRGKYCDFVQNFVKFSATSNFGISFSVARLFSDHQNKVRKQLIITKMSLLFVQNLHCFNWTPVIQSFVLHIFNFYLFFFVLFTFLIYRTNLYTSIVGWKWYNGMYGIHAKIFLQFKDEWMRAIHLRWMRRQRQQIFEQTIMWRLLHSQNHRQTNLINWFIFLC